MFIPEKDFFNWEKNVIYICNSIFVQLMVIKVFLEIVNQIKKEVNVLHVLVIVIDSDVVVNKEINYEDLVEMKNFHLSKILILNLEIIKVVNFSSLHLFEVVND